jgi:hypothetical protein
MRNPLQLAALLLFTATTAHAQFHFPQHAAKDKSPKEDVSWLAPYATPAPEGRQAELVHDPRFRSFVRQYLTAPQTFWNDNQSLADTVFEFLATPGQVVLDDNRYLSIEGCVPQFCPSRGLLFVDLGLSQPLVVFAAIDWTKDNKTPGQAGAEFTMWVFTNHPLDAIPAPLHHAIATWSAIPTAETTNTPNVTNVILVDPDGTPHQIVPSTIGVPPATTSKAKP